MIARRGTLVGGFAAAAVVVWLVLGVARVDPERELVVRVPRWGAATRVEGRITLAPPGWARLERYPLGERDYTLAPDEPRGGFGYAGRTRLEVDPSAWRELHRHAAGRGTRGVLLGALEAATGRAFPDGGEPVWTAAAGHRLRHELGAILAERGVRLVTLEVEGLRFSTLAAGEALPPPNDTRLLVVGLDGADWDILDPLIAAGKLPTLAGLVREGTRARLLTISPMLSPVIWTSIATGVEPTRHGILDFLVVDPETGKREPVTSLQRQVPTFWEVLSRRGVEVGVVGWWASWPADPVRGYLVSDRIAYQLFGFRADPREAAGKTWPAELYEEVRPLLVDPASVGRERIASYLADHPEAAGLDAREAERLAGLSTLIAAGDTYAGIARALGERRRPDLEVVYLEGTDTVAHLFMPFRPPRMPGVDPDAVARYGGVVDRYYEEADRILGELIATGEGRRHVLVVSDHGFATDETRPRSTDSRIGHGAAADWHRRFGVLIAAGPGIRRGHAVRQARVYDIAPTVLALFGQPVPESWPGRVLTELLTPEFLADNPVRRRSDDPRRDEREEWRDFEDPSAADQIAKLETLGYVGSNPASAAVTARNNQGIALLAQGRAGEAEAELRLALAEAPGSMMTRINLGLALSSQGRAAEARPLFEEAFAHPATRRRAGILLAELLREEGDLPGARERVRAVLAEEPAAADAHVTLGAIAEDEGDDAAAEAAYREAARLDPGAPFAPNRLGNLLGRTRRTDEAAEWYRRAIEADPFFIGAYNNLALLHQNRGETEIAVDLYHRALTRDPEHVVVLNNLASLYFATGRPEDAREQWEAARLADGGYASPPNNLAGLAIRDGRLVEAEALLEEALAIEPGYGDARINRAILRRRQGQPGEAREELERALADPRARAQARIQLGMLDLTEGRLEAAARELTTGLAERPGDVNALNALGEVRMLSGRPDEARRLWERSLALAPAQPAVRAALGRLASP